MSKIANAIKYINENKNKQVDVKSLIFRYCEIILLIPLFAFVVSPLYYLIVDVPFNLDYPFRGFYNYQYTTNYVIYLALVTGFAGIVISYLSRKKNNLDLSPYRQISVICFTALCLLMIVSTCVNGFTSEALHGDSYRNESLFSFLAYFVSMYFCGTLINAGKYKKLIIGTFLLSNLVIDLIELFRLYVMPLRYFEYSDADAPSSIFYQFNHYGYFLMLGIMISAAVFSMSKNTFYRVFSGMLLIINTFILTLNTTFGCFLACFFGMIFLVIVSSIIDKKFNLLSVAAFAVFIIVTFLAGLKHHSFFREFGKFFMDIKSVMGTVSEKTVSVTENEIQVSNADGAGTGRWGLWRNTIDFIKQKPLLGWGVEGIHDMLNEASNGLNNRPHNEFLQYAAFFGIPAAILYFIGLAAHFIKAFIQRHSFDTASAVCLVAAFTYLVSSVFGNTMFYTAPYFFIFLGLATGSKNKNGNS